jgi:NADP-dependent 3-hydroxy acid dehydrogenase YdfG
MSDLAQKTAIITGGGTGIGKAIATALANEDANIILASRDYDTLEVTAKELNKLGGGRVFAAACDVRDKDDINLLIQATLTSFHRIDILVNNAGVNVRKKVVNITEQEWDAVLDTNLKGTFLMTQAVLPSMMQQESGFILNIASQAAKHGYPEAGAYCASKFGMLGFAEALQHEVRSFGIRVHTLCPGVVQEMSPESTNRIDLNVLTTEDVANMALYVLQQPSHVSLDSIGLHPF